MGAIFKKERRDNDRRTEKERRKYNDSIFTGDERRAAQERRLFADRRSQIMADRTFLAS